MQDTLAKGVFDKRFSHHVFLEYNIAENEPETYFLDALGQVAKLANDELFVVIAVGPDLCRMLDGAALLPNYGEETQLVDTQGDVWIWLQGKDRSTAFDASRTVNQLLADSVDLEREVVGFVYHDMRDLTGFVDGIGNPEGDIALRTAIIADGEEGAGGSIVLTQKWVHDLASFEQLEQAEQENVIGHTKPDAQEFDHDQMPDNAHVGRVDIDVDGEPQRLWRRSVPYGDSQKHGLYFLSFADEWQRYVLMLNRMFGTADGVVDRLTDYSQPETGAWWFCPSQALFTQWTS